MKNDVYVNWKDSVYYEIIKFLGICFVNFAIFVIEILFKTTEINTFD